MLTKRRRYISQEGMKLRDWLDQENMLSKDFAAKIGKTPGYVSQVLSGIIWPSRDTFRNIRRITKGSVTPNDMLDD